MRKAAFIFSCLVLALAAAFLIAIKCGSVNIRFTEILAYLAGYNNGTENMSIILNIRLPRILFAIAVGGMLGVSGAVLQGVLKNPLVDPYITGISSGAALGASIFIIAGISGVVAPAMAGAVLTMFLVYRLSVVYGRMSITNILLIGIMIGALFSSTVLLE